MLKGVNKKIVEINNPDSLYFEKAVLYVRPDIAGTSTKLISQQADSYLKTLFPIESIKYARTMQALKKALIIATFILLGGMLYWALAVMANKGLL
ncbi:MAG: hypothetical protein LBR54_04275 [Oscillospiraceae bacterium]|jgi:hypothetical protein|nr:hypothetical protein [Oscillospiraceae bacterium]